MEENIKREYELTIIVGDAAVKKDIDKFLATPSYEAEVIGKEPAGLFQLSYPIKKQVPATMLVYYLRLLPEKIAQIKKDLSLQPYILRSMIVVREVVEEKSSVAPTNDSATPIKKPGVEISSTEELAKTLEELQ